MVGDESEEEAVKRESRVTDLSIEDVTKFDALLMEQSRRIFPAIMTDLCRGRRRKQGLYRKGYTRGGEKDKNGTRELGGGRQRKFGKRENGDWEHDGEKRQSIASLATEYVHISEHGEDPLLRP